MKPVADMEFHPTSEKIVELLCQQTQNYNPEFFRILTSYHLTKMASMMRVKVHSKDRKTIPINFYGINLASSGQGKGHSTTIIEDSIMDKFYSTFMDQSYPLICEQNLAKLSVQRAAIKETDPDEELVAVEKEFKEAGEMILEFDSGTTAAVKQFQHKLKMCDIGALNLEIDEIGSNLSSNAEVLGTFLELFDVGKVKQKLTKNTRENTRNVAVNGRTPANLLMFGAPVALLDGSRTESEFYAFLATGYARRCFFGYSRSSQRAIDLKPEDIYNSLIDTGQNSFVSDISTRFGRLANVANYNKVITIPKAISLLLIEYRLVCEKLAEKLSEHKDIEKAELSHRYFKAMKLAGAYAFLDGHSTVSEDNLYAAVKMAEHSGRAFKKINSRDASYVKLAKYIASVEHELTHVDLTEQLPFYKGSASVKAELMYYAIAWGYKNRIIIKKNFSNGIEFLSGETLQKTDLDKVRLSFSDDIAHNYKNVEVPFSKLHKMTQKPNLHWVNHHLDNGHRHGDSIIPGFNMIVLDVDGGTPLSTARLLLEDYQCLFYTTKRHTPANNRFRIVMPVKYHLHLDAQDFKEFMKNIFSWLPFPVHTVAHERPRKWATFNGTYQYNDGDQILDPMAFIPKTTKNDERKQVLLDTISLSNIERWFVHHTGDGNRSNQLVRYALMHVDQGADFAATRTAVLSLNDKLADKLDESEIDATIMATASKAIVKRDNP